MNYQKKITNTQLNNVYSTQEPQKNYQNQMQGKMNKRALSRNENNQQPKGSQRVNPASSEMNSAIQPGSAVSPVGGAVPPPVGGAVPPPVGGAVPPPVGGAVPPPVGGAVPPPVGGAVPPPVGGPIPTILTTRTFGTVRPIIPGFAVNPNIR